MLRYLFLLIKVFERIKMAYYAKEIHIPELGLTIYPKIETTVTHTQSIFEFYDARAFYRGVIKENLKDFYQDPTNTRKAINACITLYHLADWYWVNDKNKREKQKEIPHSLALSDIANGSKHFNPQKCYQSGKVEGTDIPETLTLNSDNEVIKIEDMLKEIEKFWDNKILSYK